MRFTVRQDRALIGARKPETRHLWISIEAPESPRRAARPPVNLAVVIDRSGSMAGDKLDRARRAALRAIASLKADDRFSVVIYDDAVDTLIPSCLATAENRARAEHQLAAIMPGGTTALFDGWLQGCEQIAKTLGASDVGRCLLLTDGLANRGLVDPAKIVTHVRELRERRVSTTAFGVGADFDETLMQRMAEAGGGNFYFIERAEQIPEIIASEVGEVLDIVAPGAELVVTASGAGVSVDSLNDYPVRRHGDAWRFQLGSLISGQVLNPVLSLTLPAGPLGAHIDVALTLADRDGALDAPTCDVRFERAKRAACDAQPRDREVALRAAPLRAAQASQRALERNRAGDYKAARQTLIECARHIRRDADGDAELLAIAQGLDDKVELYGQDMSPMARKMRFFDAHRSLKEKHLGGQAVRRASATSGSSAASGSSAGGIALLPASRALSRIVDGALAALRGPAHGVFPGLALRDDLLAVPELGERAGRLLTPDREAELVARARQECPDADVVFVATAQGFENNWFSHWHARERTAVVTLHAWDATAAIAPEAFIAYEIILHGLNALSRRYQMLDTVHAETRGCLFDFCRVRAEIEIKLQTMDLCPPCRRELDRIGVAPASLTGLCDAVRVLANRPRAQLGR